MIKRQKQQEEIHTVILILMNFTRSTQGKREKNLYGLEQEKDKKNIISNI